MLHIPHTTPNRLVAHLGRLQRAGEALLAQPDPVTTKPELFGRSSTQRRKEKQRRTWSWAAGDWRAPNGVVQDGWKQFSKPLRLCALCVFASKVFCMDSAKAEGSWEVRVWRCLDKITDRHAYAAALARDLEDVGEIDLLLRSQRSPSNGLLTPSPGFCMTCV